jgi:hypothetical protein
MQVKELKAQIIKVQSAEKKLTSENELLKR